MSKLQPKSKPIDKSKPKANPKTKSEHDDPSIEEIIPVVGPIFYGLGADNINDLPNVKNFYQLISDCFGKQFDLKKKC